MTRKYGALRFVAFLLQVAAWVSLIVGIIAAAGLIAAGAFNWFDIASLFKFLGGMAVGVLVGLAGAAAILVVAAIGFTVGLCLSQAIYVQIDIERNTCMTAEFLRQMLITQASSAAESPLPVATQPPAPPLSPAATPFAPPPSYTGSAPTITSPTPTQQP